MTLKTEHAAAQRKQKTVAPWMDNASRKISYTKPPSHLKTHLQSNISDFNTSTTFKERLGNHNYSFKHESKVNATELSKYIWKLKEQKRKYDIKWSIIQRASPYNSATKRCNLCLAEKYHILTAPKQNTINRRSELISNCRHRNKHKLSGFKIT